MFIMLSTTVSSATELPVNVRQDVPVTDEIGPIEARVTDIKLPGVKLSVYPKQPTGNIASRNPFFHSVYPIIELPLDYYDTTTRILKFNVRLGGHPHDISNAAMDEAKKSAAIALNQADAWEQIVINSMPLAAYRITLIHGGQRLVLSEGSATSNQLGLGENFPISQPIGDQWVHDALVNQINEVFIEFDAYYRFRVFDVQSALIEIRQHVAAETFEEVLGEGASSPAFVTRDVLNTIQQRAERSIRIQLPAGSSGELLTNLDKFKAEFSNLPPLTFGDLAAINTTLYYGADQAQLEMTPQVFKELTTEWSSSQQFEESFQETWNQFRSLQQQSSSTAEFFDLMHTRYIGGGSASAKMDILKLGSGSGRGSFNYDNTWDEQSSEQRSEFEKFAEEISGSSTVSQYILENIAEDWTGQRNIETVTAQNLQIYRISEARIEQALALVVDVIEELPSVLKNDPERLRLVGANTMIAVDLDNLVSTLTVPVADTLMNDPAFVASVTGPVGPEGPPMTNAFEIRIGNDVTVSRDERNGRSTARCSSGYTAIAVACEVSNAETFLVTQNGSFLQGDSGRCHFRFEGGSGSKDGRARVACMRSDLLFP